MIVCLSSLSLIVLLAEVTLLRSMPSLETTCNVAPESSLPLVTSILLMFTVTTSSSIVVLPSTVPSALIVNSADTSFTV